MLLIRLSGAVKEGKEENNLEKLDTVGSIDKRPLTDSLRRCQKKKHKKCNM